MYTAQYGGFTSIVADYRYEIPAATNATGGDQHLLPGPLRLRLRRRVPLDRQRGDLDRLPQHAFDAAPVDGGYLPSVDVTNLQLVLGDINPATGHATQATGDPEILLASTFGRGDFAIRPGPRHRRAHLGPCRSHGLPGPLRQRLGRLQYGRPASPTSIDPYIDGVSEVSNFGDTVTINIYDESPNSPNYDPKFLHPLGTAATNQLGQFVIQLGAASDPWFNSISSTAFNDKILGFRATDSSMRQRQHDAVQAYTLDLITPTTPDAPVLEATYDTGRFNNDDLTNLSVAGPADGPGGALSIVTPTFDVTTSLPRANPLTPNPITLTIELLRATSPNGPFFLIDSTQTGVINAGATAETYMLTDADLAAMAAAGPRPDRLLRGPPGRRGRQRQPAGLRRPHRHRQHDRAGRPHRPDARPVHQLRRVDLLAVPDLLHQPALRRDRRPPQRPGPALPVGR